MLIGHAGIAAGERTLDVRLDVLHEAGRGTTHAEAASGAKAERSVLAEVLGTCAPGGTFVLWRLDRLGRALRLLTDAHLLAGRGVGFKSLVEWINAPCAGSVGSTPARLASGVTAH